MLGDLGRAQAIGAVRIGTARAAADFPIRSSLAFTRYFENSNADPRQVKVAKPFGDANAAQRWIWVTIFRRRAVRFVAFCVDDVRRILERPIFAILPASSTVDPVAVAVLENG